MSNCHECGGRFNPLKESLGHESWCHQELDERRWLAGRLSSFEEDMGYVIVYWSDGRPNAVPGEDINYWLRNGWSKTPPPVLD